MRNFAWFYRETSYRYGLIFYIKKKTGIWEAPVLDLILSDLANVRVFAESPLDKSHLRILHFAEDKKEPLSRKILGKAAQKALGKGTGPSNLPDTAVGIFLSRL